jgi:hypothetical protein
MNLSEFKKERGCYCWIWKKRVSTPLSKFGVELVTDDQRPPDDEMLKRASELVQYARTHGDFILDIVYDSYLQHAKDKHWLEICEVPAGLTKEKVGKYLTREPKLSVVRPGFDVPYESYMFVRPLWDEEHGLDMKYLDNALFWEHDVRVKVKKSSRRT